MSSSLAYLVKSWLTEGVTFRTGSRGLESFTRLADFREFIVAIQKVFTTYQQKKQKEGKPGWTQQVIKFLDEGHLKGPSFVQTYQKVLEFAENCRSTANYLGSYLLSNPLVSYWGGARPDQLLKDWGHSGSDLKAELEQTCAQYNPYSLKYILEEITLGKQGERDQIYYYNLERGQDIQLTYVPYYSQETKMVFDCALKDTNIHERMMCEAIHLSRIEDTRNLPNTKIFETLISDYKINKDDRKMTLFMS